VTPEGTTPGKPTEYSIPVSPDGRFFAASDAKQRRLIFSVEGGEGRPIPGIVDDDRVIRWTGDGQALFVAQGTVPTKIYRLDLTTGRRELWKEIMPADPSGINNPPSVLLTPDGKWYVYVLNRQLSDLYLVEGLK
jgi:Tol biopolymer transport system component